MFSLAFCLTAVKRRANLVWVKNETSWTVKRDPSFRGIWIQVLGVYFTQLRQRDAACAGGNKFFIKFLAVNQFRGCMHSSLNLELKSMTTDIVLKLVQGQNSDTLRLKTHNQKRRGEPSFLSLLYGSFHPSIAVSQLESRATC